MTKNKSEIESVAVYGDRCAVTVNAGGSRSTVLADKAKMADRLIDGTACLPLSFGVDPAEADEHTMILMRAQYPCTRKDVADELLVQCPGVNRHNAMDVARASVDRLLRAGQIEYYERSEKGLGFVPTS